MGRLVFPITKAEAKKQGVSHSSSENKNAKFPARLRDLRREKDLSQVALASILGVSKSTIGLYETGDTLPDAQTVSSLADCFGVSSDYLLCRTDVRTPKVEDREIVAKTGLSAAAIAMLLRLNEHPSANYKQLKVISFLMENAFHAQILDRLYSYLFLVLGFVDIDHATQLERLPEDVLVYNSIPLLSINDDGREGRVIVKSEDLNDMYFVQVQSALIKLREFAIEQQDWREGGAD